MSTTPDARNDSPAEHTAPPGPGPDASSDAIIDDIDQTRKELVDTVDQLAAKLDVKAQASRQVQEVKETAITKVHAVADELTDDDGKPTPAALGGLVAVVALVVALIVWRARK
ncbi:MAG: DUF3618 domain-containing protein [Mycobacteriaceae bacterium]